jgi:DNA-binding transcriptional LysR family regulator
VSVDPPSLSELSQTRIFEDYYSIYQKVGSAVSSGDASIFTLPWATDLTGRKLQEYLDKSPIKNRILSCGDFEAAKAMLENDVGFAFMPDRVASPLVLAGKIQKVLTWPSLNHIGKHWIVFSCRKHREADEAVIWMRDQLLRMLRSSI